jgi:hypothetical protein
LRDEKDFSRQRHRDLKRVLLGALISLTVVKNRSREIIKPELSVIETFRQKTMSREFAEKTRTDFSVSQRLCGELLFWLRLCRAVHFVAGPQLLQFSKSDGTPFIPHLPFTAFRICPYNKLWYLGV